MAAVQTFLQFLDEQRAENGAIARLQLLAHIHHRDLRQRSVAHPAGHFHQRVVPPAGHGKGKNAGRSAGQNQRGSFVFAALFRHPARIVAGMLVAQISLFMFLVDHDQPQFVHRSEDGGTRAHHDPGLSRTDAPPFVIALAVGQAAMKHGGVFAEAAVKPAHHLGGQGDLRHQNDRALAYFQCPLHHGQVDLCLAAAGHAMEQERALSLFQRGNHAVQRLPLVVGQGRRDSAGRFHLRIRGPEDLPLGQRHQSLLPQRFQRVPGIGHQLSQLANAVGLAVLQKPQHHGPLGRPTQRVRLFFRVHAGTEHGAELLLHLNAPGAHGGGQH